MAFSQHRMDVTFGVMEARVNNEGEQQKLPYKRLWDDADAFYVGQKQLVNPPGADFVRRDLTSDLFETFESVLPAYFANVIENPRSVTFESPGAPDPGYKYAVQAKVDQDRRISRFKERLMPFARRGGIHGHFFHKSFWMTTVGERRIPVVGGARNGTDGEPLDKKQQKSFKQEVTHDGPWTEFPDVRRTWKSAQFDERGRYLWIVEEVDANLDYLEHINRVYKQVAGRNVYENLRKLRDTTISFSESMTGSGLTSSVGRGPNSAQATTSSSASFTTGVRDGELAGSGAIRLRQCWGWFPPASAGGITYSDTQWRLQVIAPGGVLLRDEPCPTPDLRPPHRDVRFVQIGDEPYGRSPVQWAVGEVQTASELRNLRLAEAWFNVLSTRVARKDAGWDWRSMQQAPNAVWLYDPEDQDLAPEQAIGIMPRVPIMQQSYTEVAVAEDKIKRIMSSDQNRQGEAFGARTSAFETQKIDQKSGGRIRLMAIEIARQLDKVNAEDYFALNQAYMQREQWVRLNEIHGGEDVKINPGDFRYGVDIYADDGEFNSLDQMAAQAEVTAMQAFIQLPGVLERIKGPEMYLDYLHRTGHPNPGGIFKSTAQMREEAQARQQEQERQTQQALQVDQGVKDADANREVSKVVAINEAGASSQPSK